MEMTTNKVQIRPDLIEQGLLIPVQVRLKGEPDFHETNINELPENMAYYTTDDGTTVLVNDEVVIIGQSIDFEF
jgi:hypothetical protein